MKKAIERKAKSLAELRFILDKKMDKVIEECFIKATDSIAEEFNVEDKEGIYDYLVDNYVDIITEIII